MPMVMQSNRFHVKQASVARLLFRSPRNRHGRGRVLPAAILAGLVGAAASCADAAVVLGTSVNGSATVTFIGGSFSNSTAIIQSPGIEFSGHPGGAAGNASDIIGDFTANTIRVGYLLTNGTQAGAGSSVTTIFNFTGLTVSPGEAITGLSVLTNSRSTGGQSFSTTADSITITFTGGFLLGAFTGTNDFDDTVTYNILTAPVPEPGSLILCGPAALAACFRRRRAAGNGPDA